MHDIKKEKKKGRLFLVSGEDDIEAAAQAITDAIFEDSMDPDVFVPK